jgi:hypothetical protein
MTNTTKIILVSVGAVILGAAGLAGGLLIGANRAVRDRGSSVTSSSPVLTPVPKGVGSRIGVKESTNSVSPILSLSVPKLQVRVGEKFTTSVNLDTVGLPIYVTDIDLIYDPKTVELVGTLKPGGLFSNEIVLANRVDPKTGRVVISLGSLSPFVGKGVLGTLEFSAKKLGSAKISFDSIQLPKIGFADKSRDGTVISGLLPITVEITN